jgi:hypothetical protein
MLGRALYKREVVHHIDGDRHNNDPSNLMVITQGQHMQEHGLGLPGVTPKHKPWEKRRKGQDDPNSVFIDEDIRRIREMALFGGLQREIGAMFGVGQSQISQIVRYVRWEHVV